MNQERRELYAVKMKHIMWIVAVFLLIKGTEGTITHRVWHLTNFILSVIWF